MRLRHSHNECGLHVLELFGMYYVFCVMNLHVLERLGLYYVFVVMNLYVLERFGTFGSV